MPESGGGVAAVQTCDKELAGLVEPVATGLIDEGGPEQPDRVVVPEHATETRLCRANSPMLNMMWPVQARGVLMAPTPAAWAVTTAAAREIQ